MIEIIFLSIFLVLLSFLYWPRKPKEYQLPKPFKLPRSMRRLEAPPDEHDFKQWLQDELGLDVSEQGRLRAQKLLQSKDE